MIYKKQEKFNKFVPPLNPATSTDPKDADETNEPLTLLTVMLLADIWFALNPVFDVINATIVLHYTFYST